MISRTPYLVSSLRSTLPLVQTRQASTLPTLSSIEASWKSLSPAEQEATYKHLGELQKKDWKELSLDEKKAAYYVSYGPHGPREPILPAGSGAKTLFGVLGAIAAAGGVFYLTRLGGKERPKTITREWQEASNEAAKENKADPFTGPTSEGYKGKGYVSVA